MTTPNLPSRALAIGAGVLMFSSTLHADVTLPALFTDHMVLQRGTTVPVWGWADEGEEVTVTFAGQTKKTKAGADKKWKVKLESLKANAEAAALTVAGKNTLTINDVLVGDVWLCSGQSNMAWSVSASKDFETEKAAATFPKIRMFREASGVSTEPKDKPAGTWAVCSPDTVQSFSATGYFFGRELHQKLNVPIGLINSSVGGTPIESWTSEASQKDVPQVKFIYSSWEQRIATYDPAKAQTAFEKAKADFEKAKEKHKEAVEKAKAENKPAPQPPRAPQPPTEPRLNNHYPGNLYNGKIAPLVPYAIKGAIWYQGESNADTIERGQAYKTQLPLLVKDWRKQWGYDFPFAWVQLPEFTAREANGWSLVQEAMLQSLKTPGTGMAIAMGLGEEKDIHPKNKQDVGKRLAAWALAKVYAQKGAYSGPIYASKKAGKKGDITITFTQTDGGLVAKDGEVKGFEIAGEDKVFKPAVAKIAGKTSVTVSSPEVPKPVAVRYAWDDFPAAFTLGNGAGFPASPFRTDTWELASALPPAPAPAPAAPKAPAPAPASKPADKPAAEKPAAEKPAPAAPDAKPAQ